MGCHLEEIWLAIYTLESTLFSPNILQRLATIQEPSVGTSHLVAYFSLAGVTSLGRFLELSVFILLKF